MYISPQHNSATSFDWLNLAGRRWNLCNDYCTDQNKEKGEKDFFDRLHVGLPGTSNKGLHSATKATQTAIQVLTSGGIRHALVLASTLEFQCGRSKGENAVGGPQMILAQVKRSGGYPISRRSEVRTADDSARCLSRSIARTGNFLYASNFFVRFTIFAAMFGDSGFWRRMLPVWLGILSVPLWAQAPKTQTPSNQGGYVFHSNTREVLTDVTVTDKHGNPIDGLSRSAFHIFDNGNPQKLESFEEHAGAPAAVAATSAAPNVFSNAYLQHLPPSLNAILIDTTTIDIVDQMVLNQEMMRFVNALPANQSVAIYQ